MGRLLMLTSILMILILGFGSTAVFPQSLSEVTAVVGFYTRNEYGTSTFYRGAGDLNRLDENNMWECRKTLGEHDYLLRIFKADNGNIRIFVNVSHTDIKLPKASFRGVLEMPTAAGPGYTDFDSTDPFLLAFVWTYPTKERLAEKTVTKDQNMLPCSLKAKDESTKAYSITLPYRYFENP